MEIFTGFRADGLVPLLLPRRARRSRRSGRCRCWERANWDAITARSGRDPSPRCRRVLPDHSKLPGVHTVAVLSLKGGVGKTTVVLGLASAALRRGVRTLVVDLDPQ